MNNQHNKPGLAVMALLTVSVMLSACSTGAQEISEPPLAAQEINEIEGIWEGTLDVGGTELPLVFRINAEGVRLAGTMDSPSQGVKGMAVDDVRYNGDRLTLRLERADITYTGAFVEPNQLAGVFTQRGAKLNLALSRVEVPSEHSRPQDPKPPFPYQVEEVTFSSPSEGSQLTGSLTLPPTIQAVAVLVSGSGQQDRDETVMGHKPFWVLADYLSRRGIAVLRYDDRGMGGSTGPIRNATTLNFANDADAALDFVKSRQGLADKPLGIIGHSEGGAIASILGARRDDLAFLVLLAGPGVNGIELLEAQNRAIFKAEGLSNQLLEARLNITRKVNDIMVGNNDPDVALQNARDYITRALEPYSDRQRARMDFSPQDIDVYLRQLQSPWWRYMLASDPARELSQIQTPLLALYGTRDLQVLTEQNAPAVRAALESAGNSQFEIQIFENLNHLFQTAETGLPSEYATIDETIAPVVLAKISRWIHATVLGE